MRKSQSLLLAVGLLCLSPPAFAGHWTTSYETSGNCIGEDPLCYPLHGETGVSRGTHPWLPSQPIDHEEEIQSILDAGPISDSIIGDVTVVFTWTPDNAGDLPPTSLSVLEDLNMADSYAYPNGPSVTSTHNTTVKGLHGKGLAQIPNPGQASVLRLPVRHFSAIGSTPYQTDDVMLGLLLKYSASPDTRSLSLSRGGRYERQVLEGDEWHTYGDSIYSADNETDPNLKRLVPLNISASYGGGWSTNKSHSWSPQGFDSTGSGPAIEEDEANCSGVTIFGSLLVTIHILPGVNNHYYEYYGSLTGPSTKTTSLSVIDNVDLAKAKAYYHLNLHDPVEPISSQEGESVTISHYRILSPMSDGSGPLAYYGYRPANAPETTVKIGSSTESGIDLKATTDITPVKDFLGFSGEAHITSTYSVSVDTEAKVPAINGGKLRYLIAIHDFSRRHSRFYKYDELGKVKRFISQDSTGGTYNPPVETYHEAIRDTAAQPQYQWSDEKPATTDINNLPTITEPEPSDYDFSGDVS